MLANSIACPEISFMGGPLQRPGESIKIAVVSSMFDSRGSCPLTRKPHAWKRFQKKKFFLNVSYSCCRNTNDNLHLQDLPIAFCKLCQQNLQQLETRTLTVQFFKFQKMAKALLQTQCAAKGLIQGQCVIMLMAGGQFFFIKMALLEDSVT